MFRPAALESLSADHRLVIPVISSHPTHRLFRICGAAAPPSGTPRRIAFPRRSGVANRCGKGVVRDELAAPTLFTRS